MKRLSPSEPYISLNLEIYSKGLTPVSRLGRILQSKYGYRVELYPPYRIVAKNRYKLTSRKDLDNIMNYLKNLLMELEPYTELYCIEIYAYIENISHKIVDHLSNECNSYENTKRRILLCILDDKTIYIMYNKRKRYITIRSIHGKIISRDPLMVPKTLFRKCGKVYEVISYAGETLNNISWYLEQMMNALSKDPSRG
jgi:hypothetical protein